MEVHSFFSRNFSVKAWYVVVDVISLLCSIWDHLLVEICHLTGIAVGYFFHLSTIGGNKIVFHCKKKFLNFRAPLYGNYSYQTRIPRQFAPKFTVIHVTRIYTSYTIPPPTREWAFLLEAWMRIYFFRESWIYIFPSSGNWFYLRVICKPTTFAGIICYFFGRF